MNELQQLKAENESLRNEIGRLKRSIDEDGVIVRAVNPTSMEGVREKHFGLALHEGVLIVAHAGESGVYEPTAADLDALAEAIGKALEEMTPKALKHAVVAFRHDVRVEAFLVKRKDT